MVIGISVKRGFIPRKMLILAGAAINQYPITCYAIYGFMAASSRAHARTPEARSQPQKQEFSKTVPSVTGSNILMQYLLVLCDSYVVSSWFFYTWITYGHLVEQGSPPLMWRKCNRRYAHGSL